MMKRHWFILLICSSCYLADDVPPDQEVWDYDLPKNQGLDQEILLTLNTRIEEQEFGSIDGLIIIKNDQLVFENYYNGSSERLSTASIGSLGTTITLAALGAAIDQRLLAVEDSIFQYLPEYSEIFEQDPDKRAITIEDVMTHRTGLSWNEGVENLFTFVNGELVANPDSNLNQMKLEEDWVVFLLSRTNVGLGFSSYCTANGLLLAKIIENATGRDYAAYLNEQLFEPLAITNFALEQDPQGNYNGGDGYTLSLLDLTKISYLYLNEGLWENRVLSNTNFIRDAISPQYEFSQSSFGSSIGYFWNFINDNFEGLFNVDIENIYFLVGDFGESICILPDEEMVIVFQSDVSFGVSSQPLNLIIEITRAVISTQ